MAPNGERWRIDERGGMVETLYGGSGSHDRAGLAATTGVSPDFLGALVDVGLLDAIAADPEVFREVGAGVADIHPQRRASSTTCTTGRSSE